MSPCSECRACHAAMRFALSYPFADFDGSIFRFDGRILECPCCGFVRVDSDITDALLTAHYSQDCLYSQLSGAGVGGDTPEDILRYEIYKGFMERCNLSTHSLVDVGCSRGGFLKYLAAHGYPLSGLVGIDVDQTSLGSLRTAGIVAQFGDVMALPFTAGSQQAIAYLNVLEHVLDIDRLLSEASRVLSVGGQCLFDVPDAGNYRTDSVGPGFWSGMKEHVNHFSGKALELALARHRMEIVGMSRFRMSMKAGTRGSSLVVAARKCNREVAVDHSAGSEVGRISTYFRDQAMAIEEQIRRINSFCAGVDRIAFWGVALEFFNLVAFGVLSEKRTITLMDRLPAKIGRSVSGLRVLAPSEVTPQGKLVICSYLSRDSIFRDATARGWRPEDILAI